jgi:hypothetical protein
LNRTEEEKEENRPFRSGFQTAEFTGLSDR